MFSSSLIAAAVLTAVGVNAVPTVTPTLDLLKRQGLANVYYSCNNPNDVALTFDDGPYIYENDIVNLLNQHGAKGTFFVNGNNYACIYGNSERASIQNAYYSGHQIGSHTWAHKDLSTLSWDNIHDEMWRVELAMIRILGVSPAFMRPPYGNYNDLVRSASAIRGQSLVIWDFDSGDSVGASPDQSKSTYQNTINGHPNNILALNHETLPGTAYNVLPFAIQQLQAAGYNLVTVAQCLGMEPYQFYQQPGTPDGSWTC